MLRLGLNPLDHVRKEILLDDNFPAGVSEVLHGPMVMGGYYLSICISFEVKIGY